MKSLQSGAWVVGLMVLALLWGCSGNNGGKNVVPQDDDEEPSDDTGNHGDTPTAPYDRFQWTTATIIESEPARAAGWQGKLVRGNDGVLYYAYLKHAEPQSTCDIAVFAGGEAPGISYEVKVAVRAPGETTWSVETLPLTALLSARYGLGATLDGDGHLVLAFAGGTKGLFTCGSADLIVATRTAANTYSLITAVEDSAACCSAEECGDPACTSGSDVGAWASVIADDTGNLLVAFMDYHNAADEDGQSHTGLELWEQGGAVTGIRPWSGTGHFNDLIWAKAHGEVTFEGPVIAYTAFKGGSLYVARRTGTAGTKDDWQGHTLRFGDAIGQRISLAQAPNGTLGIAFHVRANALGTPTNDLFVCESADNGATWGPCFPLDEPVRHVGANPSLAYDSESRPGVSYYVCGATADCQAQGDGLRYAWRDDNHRWWYFNIYFDSTARAGTYSQVVFDAETNAPTFVLQDLTRGAAVSVDGYFTAE